MTFGVCRYILGPARAVGSAVHGGDTIQGSLGGRLLGF